MKRCLPIHIIIALIVFLLCFSPTWAEAKRRKKPIRIEKPEVADSILNNVIVFAPLYEKIVAEYKADLYIKGKLNAKRLNHLIKIVPSMFTLNKRVKEYLMESVNEMHYTAPSIYDMKVKAVSGTIPRFKGDHSAMLEYFNMNIYSS
ncbi:MAG: DUF5686 family protein, partial [Bacteroidaceae bacterium]